MSRLISPHSTTIRCGGVWWHENRTHRIASHRITSYHITSHDHTTSYSMNGDDLTACLPCFGMRRDDTHNTALACTTHCETSMLVASSPLPCGAVVLCDVILFTSGAVFHPTLQNGVMILLRAPCERRRHGVSHRDNSVQCGVFVLSCILDAVWCIVCTVHTLIQCGDMFAASCLMWYGIVWCMCDVVVCGAMVMSRLISFQPHHTAAPCEQTRQHTA